jgi:hypothetical protein
MRVHDFVEEGLGHSSGIVMCGHGERAMTARGHAQLTVLDWGPYNWAAATGHPLDSGR